MITVLEFTIPIVILVGVIPIPIMSTDWDPLILGGNLRLQSQGLWKFPLQTHKTTERRMT